MPKPKEKLPRPPKVENKYDLTLKKVRAMSINWDKVSKTDSKWWRNNVINAWCLSQEVGDADDVKYGTSDGYVIIFYDEGAAKKRLRISCDSYGGMCGYNFNEFYEPSDIDGLIDLQLQEELLKELNKLIDDGVLFEHTETVPVDSDESAEQWKI